MRYKQIFGLLAVASTVLSGVNSMAADSDRYVRYSLDGTAHYGVEDGDLIHQLNSAPWHGGERTGETVQSSNVRVLAPAEPSKVIAVGYNYISHREDMTHVENRPIPEYPPLFLKLPTSITGPDTDVPYPSDATDLHYEAELVVVIGKTASKVSAETLATISLASRPATTLASETGKQMTCNGFEPRALTSLGRSDPRL